ncbi:hypothetical protein FSP39_008744 [Pinctada imbricata]|uniref:Uncharacterized protein n=1 Tax=Pinctada imbricata TaxID=66713 RepID=A0AA89C4B8_PINIB|nr:hypothetical protein FSP39_008744 [Pinctada imbricata]
MGQIFSGPNESEISEKVLQERESESEFSEKVSKTFAVAAIDIGTTFSGYAFSFKHDFLKDPTRVLTKHWKSTSGEIQSNKTPTCILFNQNNEFHSFGYEAEDAYADKLLENANDASRWSFFRSFKMTLYDQADLHEGFLLESTNGNTLPALTVFAESIRYMKDVMLEHCMEKTIGITMEDIAWVVTVPAIWSDPAKKFMRLAAENAGIQTDRLSLALEPEAAALYVRHIPFERPNERILRNQRSVSHTVDNQNAFQNNMLVKVGPGERYMVVDAGGGTVDIAVHETKNDGKLREVYMANGGDWGGTKVDEGFQNFLADLMSPRTNSCDKGIVELEGGKKVLKAFEENYIDEDLEVKRHFEQKKRGIKESMTSKLTVRISPELHEAFAQIYPGENLKELDLNRFDGNVKWVHDKLQINNPSSMLFFQRTY